MGEITYAAWEIEKPVNCSFDPQPDITAYELARILPYFHGKCMREDDWIALGTMQRHFKRYGETHAASNESQESK